jgi:two-component system sensor histidine kinase KdpD
MSVISNQKEYSAPLNYLRRVNLIRFVLPILLFTVVVVYETQEHWIKTGQLGFELVSEIVFFGIMGPLAVFITLTYVLDLLKTLERARQETENLNRNLEFLVEERTTALEIKNLELAKANTELHQLDKMKSDFVSLVSHELRAPLTNLNGALELALQNSDQIPAQTQRILALMSQESTRLTLFVRNLLDMSQLEAGKLTLNVGPVAVLPLMTRAVETVLPNTNRPIQWETPSTLPPVWADEIYLEEVIRNLLTNADKYTPPQSPINLAVSVNDAVVEIAITDYGPGIPSALQEKVFDQFYRQENGDKVSSRGWGLGLYFARALTEAQAGRLALISPVHKAPHGPGTRFTITLPLAEEETDDL